MSPPQPSFTRRAFIRLSVVGAGALLASCTSPQKTGSVPTSGAAAAARPTTAAASAAAVNIFTREVTVQTLEQELALPPAVLDGARREGKVSIISSWDTKALGKFFDAFKSRYPEIVPDYQEANEEVRTIRTLTELKAGRNQTDVAVNIAGYLGEYRNANALTPLNDLPAYANYGPPLSASDNLWCGYQLQIWGAGCNTGVPENRQPTSWDELTQPQWKGKVGLADRPQLWLQQIWAEWGAERTTDFLKRLFANQPQRRKEGLDALGQLMAAGEFDVVVPASTSRMERTSKAGLPVTWLPLEPFTVASGDIGILKGPHPNAAKVFVNWLMSREGNAAFWEGIPDVMTHPALIRDPKYLGIYADRIKTHHGSVQQPDETQTGLAAVRKVWQELWLS